MDSIQLSGKEKKEGGVAYTSVPALKLGRLATCESVGRQGVGAYLIATVIKFAEDLSQTIGCRYVTLDALAHRVNYYSNLGFVMNQRVNKQKLEAIQERNKDVTELENVSMRFDLKP